MERLLGHITTAAIRCETTVDAGNLGPWLKPTVSEDLQMNEMLRSAVFAGIGDKGPERVLAT
jgi:hypothetical protein